MQAPARKLAVPPREREEQGRRADARPAFTALGRTDRALELLARAVRGHDDYAGDVAVDPVFLPLHGDPRFQRLLVEGGLT